MEAAGCPFLSCCLSYKAQSISKAVRASFIRKNYIDDKHNAFVSVQPFNPLNTELNPICNLLAFLGAHHILYVSRISVKFQWLLYVTPGIITKLLRSAHTVHLCVSYGSEKQQRLLTL